MWFGASAGTQEMYLFWLFDLRLDLFVFPKSNFHLTISISYLFMGPSPLWIMIFHDGCYTYLCDPSTQLKARQRVSARHGGATMNQRRDWVAHSFLLAEPPALPLSGNWWVPGRGRREARTACLCRVKAGFRWRLGWRKECSPGDLGCVLVP